MNHALNVDILFYIDNKLKTEKSIFSDKIVIRDISSNEIALAIKSLVDNYYLDVNDYSTLDSIDFEIKQITNLGYDYLKSNQY